MTGLIIDTDDRDGLKDATKNIIKQHLNIDTSIKSAIKLNNNTCRIELEKFEDKLQIMKNKYKLRVVADSNIYINNDMTIEERKIQYIIRQKAAEERKKGNDVKMGYQKISINGRGWVWDGLEGKLIEKGNQTRENGGGRAKN